MTLDQHEAEGQQQHEEEEEEHEGEEEKDVKTHINRAKRSRYQYTNPFLPILIILLVTNSLFRLEIPGLLHPDDLIPSRSKRRGSRGGKRKRVQPGHDHTKDVISFIKKTHNTMYGDGNSGRSSLQHHTVSSHQHTHYTPSLNTLNQLSVQQYGNVTANPISENWTGKENRSQGTKSVRPLWADTGDLHISHSVFTDSRVPDSDHHSELETNSSCSLYPGEEEYARTNRSIIDRIMFQDREEREDMSSRLMWQRETGYYDTSGGSMTDGQGQQLTKGLVCQGKKDENNGGNLHEERRNVSNNNDIQSEVLPANFIHVHTNTNTSDSRPFPSQFKKQADKQSSNCFESLLEDISPTRYTSDRRENYDTIKSSMTTGDFLQEIVSNNCQAHSVSPKNIFSKTTEQTGTENTMYGLIDKPTNDSAQNYQRNPFMIHQTNDQVSNVLNNSIHNAHECVNPLDNNNKNNQHHNSTQNNHHYYQNINTTFHQHDNYNRESNVGSLFGNVEYNEEERSKGQRVPSPDLFATQDFADGQRSKSALPNFRPHNIFSSNPHVGCDPPPDSSSRSSFPSCLPSTPPKHISKHPSQVSPPPPHSPYFASHLGPLHSSCKSTLSQTPLPVTPNSHNQTGGGEEGPERMLYKTPQQANPHRSGQHFFFSPKSSGYQSGWSGGVRGGRVQVVRVESQMVVNATPHNKLETTKAQVVSSYLLDSQGNDLQRAHPLLPSHHHHHPVLDLYSGVPYP
ncbi:hypothetical protein Pcinc_036610 [Petrolisthes cinctipes]|uniref:Uncharacterized protein n=1 Tax=Petrolisthes cinctipes TaxID=88211 RepID=A0AAE1ENI0_PETCI|nr:hypothetical protein Pcinc_036610 [Petrolisthes cinctipes]